MKQITSPNAPQALGPYSQAIKVGNTLYCSGQIGIDPITNELKQDITGQTKQILENFSSIIKEAGMTLSHIVKTDIFLTDIAHFEEVNNVYGMYFTKPFPARATVAVTRLPKRALVEISCVAYKEN